MSKSTEEAARYERLSKSTGDRELAAYYAAKAKDLRSPAAMVAVAEEQLEEVKRRVTAEVTQELWAQKARKSLANNQAVRPTGDKVVNDTAKAGLLANAEAADNERREHERRAVEAENAVRRVNDRELVNHYSTKAREHRGLAELARSRAESFRRAANSLG